MLATDTADLDRLLLAVAARDAVAFRRLYDLTAAKLLGVVLRIMKSRSIAEEVLQDVFLRIWLNADRFSPETAPAQVWLNAVARNRAIDVLRQKGPTAAVQAEDVAWYERISEDREGALVDIASLRRCLGQLDAQMRGCVLLAYYEGFSREELAQRYNRPVNTIKTWLHRSLAVLRDCLDGAPA